METLWKDLRYGLRMLLRNPGFTSVAVLSLALGIGANTTIFTLINAIFLQPLPVAHADRLVSVFTTDEKNPGMLPTSFPNYEDYRDKNQVFEGLASFTFLPLSLSGDGQPEQINAQMVTGNYFDLLGVKAAMGRTFLPEESKTPGTHPVAVLSHGFWKRRFGADKDIVGRMLTLNHQGFTVIGVAPNGFNGTFGIGGPDIWVPAMMHDQLMSGTFREWFNERRALLFAVVGRLKPGTDLDQADAAMKTLARQLEQEYPLPNKGRGAALVPLAQSTLPPNQRPVFLLAGQLLMTVVGLVLLIACANVANLLLARATSRRKEIAIRLSLGASRGRLIRQLLTESLLLSLAGGGAGFLLAFWFRDLLWAFRPPFLPAEGLDLGLDARVMLFTLGLSLATGLLFGLAPALQSTRPDLVSAIKTSTGAPGRVHHSFNLRNLLVVSQVALSLVSLVGAGLFLRSLRNAQRVDVGFDAGSLVVMTLDPGSQGYDEPRSQEFYRQAVERVEALPGVRAVSMAENRPLAGGGFMRSVFLEGQEPAPGGRGVLVQVNTVGPRYFETLRVPIINGREFSGADRKGAPGVVIVNEAMAARFWPEQDPLGKRFKFFGEENAVEVVGVARNTKVNFIGEDPVPFVYYPLEQNFSAAMNLFVSAADNPAAVLGTARGTVQAMEPDMPLVGVARMAEVIDNSLWAPRMGAGLLGIFGLLAMILAALGIYGVMAYSVSQRTREIGIRMALGAQRRDVVRLVLRQGLAIVGTGVVAGLAVSLVLTRLLTTLLFGVNPADPLVFLGTALILCAAAMAAGYLPARRATKVDPLVALRYE